MDKVWGWPCYVPW